MNAQRMPSISSSIWETNSSTKQKFKCSDFQTRTKIVLTYSKVRLFIKKCKKAQHHCHLNTDTHTYSDADITAQHSSVTQLQKTQIAEPGFKIWWEHTHHVFLVLLEVCVDKKAAGGINKWVLHVVNTLIPARGQRGGSCGYLMGARETEIQGDIAPKKQLPLTSFH